MRDFDAFKIMKNGKVLDYVKGGMVDLKKVNKYFADLGYGITELKPTQRHILGKLEKNSAKYFLKLATSEGISVLTEIESRWNKKFNQYVTRRSSPFWVPATYDEGYFNKNLFYLITDRFEGKLLSTDRSKSTSFDLVERFTDRIIEFSELIQDLNLTPLGNQENMEKQDYQQWFIAKTNSWYKGIPNEIIKKYDINKLLGVVENNAKLLKKKTRHGDFTPWHMFLLENDVIGLFDGEHARSNGVEYYDIGYFIQRVFCVLEKKDFTTSLIDKLSKRGYNLDKLRTVLAARAIGGFFDASRLGFSTFKYDNEFKEFVLSI